MVSADKYKKVFVEKLLVTNDFDLAFKKATWMAFNEGMLEILKDPNINREVLLRKVQKILENGYEKKHGDRQKES